MTYGYGKQEFTAVELLNEYIELLQLSPKSRTWAVITEKKNAPRYFRFRRLVALFTAFGLPLDYAGFANGDFLEARDPLSADTLHRLLPRIEGRATKHNQEYSERDMQRVFGRLFSFLVVTRKYQSFKC